MAQLLLLHLIVMIKKALLGLYIFIVLAIAGFARADVKVLSVEKISDRLIAVSGRYMAPCNVQIAPSLSEVIIGAVKNTAVVKLTKAESSEENFCLGMDQEYQFDLVIDLALFHFGQSGQYDVVMANSPSVSPLNLEIEDKNSHGDYFTSIVRGVLVFEYGSYFVRNHKEGAEQTYKLNSASVIEASLDNYVGQQVSISGYLFSDESASIQNPFSSREAQSYNTLVVSSISSSLDMEEEL